MKYCSIPKTGERISRLGFSLRGLADLPSCEQKRIVQASIEAGVNILDIMPGHESSCDGFKQVVRSMRERLMIQTHFGSALDSAMPITCQARFRLTEKHLRYQLGSLGLGYVDFAVIGCGHDVEIDEVIHGGLLDYAVRQRDAGLIRYLAFSTDSSDSARKYMQTDAFDWAMIPIDVVLRTCNDKMLGGAGKINPFLEELSERRIGFAICDLGCGAKYARTSNMPDCHAQVKDMQQAMRIPGARTIYPEVHSFDDALQIIESFESASEGLERAA